MPIDEQLDGISSLSDALRRDLYRFVVNSGAAVTREEAAAAVGIPAHRAKFHLDRLETAGLLVSEYARPTGVGGPGAGRPSKRYRRADTDFFVSLPPREYELAAKILAQAVSSAAETGTDITEAVSNTAQAAGEQLAPTGLAAYSSEQALSRTCETLADHGFEPQLASNQITLRNCPFHALATEHTGLVCGMNHSLICGMVADNPSLSADLEPQVGNCCVVIRQRAIS